MQGSQEQYNELANKVDGVSNQVAEIRAMLSYAGGYSVRLDRLESALARAIWLWRAVVTAALAALCGMVIKILHG